MGLWEAQGPNPGHNVSRLPGLIGIGVGELGEQLFMINGCVWLEIGHLPSHGVRRTMKAEDNG